MVVDRNGVPLMPCLASRARILCSQKKAKIYCWNPFAIQLFNRIAEESEFQNIELKLDPGSKVTGLAINVFGSVRGWFAAMAFHIEHRSNKIVKNLISRRKIRSSRRSRKTRYRAPRFQNRSISSRVRSGYNIWLPPSAISRIDNVVNMVNRLRKYIAVKKIVGEINKFDTQKMINSDICGVEYQQGTLFGFEVREYILEKFNYTCVYCQKNSFKDGVKLEIDHVIPRSRGGSNSLKNLVLSCSICNQKKGSQKLDDFLANDLQKLRKIKDEISNCQNFKGAAQMNSARKELYGMLEKKTGLSVDVFYAFQTRFNRVSQFHMKDHWVDASCVGDSGKRVNISYVSNVHVWRSIGRGSRQMCMMNKYGLPRSKAKGSKRFFTPTGLFFQTGDRVKMSKGSGIFKVSHFGTVVIRSTGKFDIILKNNKKISSTWKNFVKLNSFNGYKIITKKVL